MIEQKEPLRTGRLFVGNDIGELTDQAIKDKLADPDLSSKTEEWKLGYAQGFKEATLAYILSQLRKH